MADDVRILLKVILSLEQPSKVKFGTSKLNFGPQNVTILDLKSQHLVINLDQGPHLKCAPSDDSMNASIIIKSYNLKSGVMQNQNFNF